MMASGGCCDVCFGLGVVCRILDECIGMIIFGRWVVVLVALWQTRVAMKMCSCCCRALVFG